MPIDLRGKVAIVTGAGRGIGREIASTLASEGVTTVVTDVRQDLLDDVAKDFAARGWAGQQYVCDVRDAARIAEVVDAVVRALGRIDILVNNAGVAPGAPVEQLSEETWDLNMDVNLKGTFLMCRAVAPVMKRHSCRAHHQRRVLRRDPADRRQCRVCGVEGRRALLHPRARGGARALGRDSELLCAGDDSHRDEPLRRGAAPAPGAPARYADPQAMGPAAGRREPDLLSGVRPRGLHHRHDGRRERGKLATQIPRLAWEGAAAAGEVTLGRGDE